MALVIVLVSDRPSLDNFGKNKEQVICSANFFFLGVQINAIFVMFYLFCTLHTLIIHVRHAK